MPAVLRAIGMRLLYGVPVLVVVTLGAAFLAQVMPGSPAEAILGASATPSEVAQLNREYGYNLPVLDRYWHWAWSALHGNLGMSLFADEPVTTVLASRLAVTAEIAGLALVISTVLALGFSLYAAYQQGGLVDRAVHVVSSALLSVPSFVSVIVLSLFFSQWLRILPATGWVPLSQGIIANLAYAVLPVSALAMFETAFFYRVLRTALVGTLREDFVLVVRSKGLSKRYILVHHVLRPSLSSFVTVLGVSIGRLLGGAVIVETFFAIPGLGAAAVNAASDKDLPVLQGIVALAVVMYVVIFILVDLAYAWIDPRVSVR
jgi:peptide/nickel transport system permease protein